jgi:hypothetical protein
MLECSLTIKVATISGGEYLAYTPIFIFGQPEQKGALIFTRTYPGTRWSFLLIGDLPAIKYHPEDPLTMTISLKRLAYKCFQYDVHPHLNHRIT